MAFEQPPSGREPGGNASGETKPNARNTEPKAEIVRKQRICPYLGLQQDRTVIAVAPTAAHACYAQKRRIYPSIEHQHARCFSETYPECSYYPGRVADKSAGLYTLSDTLVSDRKGWIPWTIAALTLLLLAALVFAYMSGMIPSQWIAVPAVSNATEIAPTAEIAELAPAAISSPTPLLTPTPTLIDPVINQVGSASASSALPLVTDDPSFGTPTPGAEGQILTLMPRGTDVNWWVSSESQRSFVGDSFLYAGFFDQMAYISAVRFDLRRVIRGTPIQGVTLRLTGLRDDRLDRAMEINWSVQLIAENDLPDFSGADFVTVFSAPAAISLLPQLEASDIAPGRVNEWILDEDAENWLFQQILDGATSVTFRISASPVRDNALFAWDSGYGGESSGALPQLVLDLGPPPATPPPTATRPVIVATLTSAPVNVLTVVAQTPTATVAQTVQATDTPALSFEVVTPTPFPENLETVQAVAIAQGLPPVVLHTPVPANAATATTDAALATAVALTTGTFTPVPTNYVTPALYFPSPPPENVATAAARALTATAVASAGDIVTPTLPWNAVPGVYAFATVTPANQETAVALIVDQNSMAVTTGTPTPTPWNLLVITPVPPPPPTPLPTPTPIPLVVSAADLTPTLTPTPTRSLTSADFERFRNKILFLSDRSGRPQTWILDPATGEVVGYITDDRIHTQAREMFLANAPDGKRRAVVQQDGRGDLQIMIEELGTSGFRQVTDLDYATNYDPAWSPNGQRIVFVSTDSGGDEIYTISPEGEGLQRLTFNSWEWDKHPTWSPDSNQIVFFSNRDTGRRQLWIMNSDGSDQRNLSNSDFEDWDPVWVR
jgi:hypothetical protein